MPRRSMSTAAITAVLTLLVSACGTTPGLTDPREIISQGIEATADVSSFHLELSVDGSVSVPDLGGGEMSLNGTSVEGDFDLEGPAAQLAVAVPAFLGLTAEVIVVGEDMYLKSSLTGPLWQHMEASEGNPVSEAADPAAALEGLNEFLDNEDVEVEKLDDADCGDDSCYHVRLTIPASELTTDVPDVGMPVDDLLGEDLVLDLLFDRNDAYLVEVSTELTAASMGTVSLTLGLSAFGEAVDVEAPPADEVTEGGGFGF